MAAAGALGLAEAAGELGFIDEMTNIIERMVVQPGESLKGLSRQSVNSSLTNALGRGLSPSVAFRQALSNLLGAGAAYGDVSSINRQTQDRLDQMERDIIERQSGEESKDVFVDIPLDESAPLLRQRAGRRPIGDRPTLTNPLSGRNLVPRGSISQDPTAREITRSNPFYNPLSGRNLRPSGSTMKTGVAGAAAAAGASIIATTGQTSGSTSTSVPSQPVQPVQPPVQPVVPSGPSYTVGEETKQPETPANPEGVFEGPLLRPNRRPRAPAVIQPVQVTNSGTSQPVTTDTNSFPDSGVRGKFIRRTKGVFYPAMGEPYMQAMIHNLFLN